MGLGEKQAVSVPELDHVHPPQSIEPEDEPKGLDGQDRLNRLKEVVESGLDHLLALQEEDGHWCAELEGDTILESEYVLGLHILGRSREERGRKAANYLRRQQLAHGGWANYPDGPPEVSASVKAYFVLKLMGDDPNAPHMRKARRTILSLGGVDACNSFTKLYLSIFGQYEWDKAPAVPPELVLLPSWFYFNIYAMSSWSRAIVVPLSVIWATKPHCPVPDGASIGELKAGPSSIPKAPTAPRPTLRERFWSRFFVGIDKALKLVEGLSFTPLRKRALERAESWILERLEDSDGLGAIFPAILNTVVALKCLGYDMDDPIVAAQMGELEKLEIEENDAVRLQPCFSPVWDTCLSVNTLLEVGLNGAHPAVEKGVEWLLNKEVKRPGDWRVKNPEGEVGGWFFEYANEFYPDCDDTAEVLAGLSQLELRDPVLEGRRQGALDRALKWQLSMQNKDGGWAAFDKGCDRELLTLVPFADHNAMIDPSTTDITGRTLEALAYLGFERSHPVVERAVRFLHREQEEDGSWYGRWGANYIYGTWLALCGLARMGEGMSSEPCRRGAAWLLGCQNEDGGWGESLYSYHDPSTRGQGPSSAAQTAWAMMGLMSVMEGREATRTSESAGPHSLESDTSVRIAQALHRGSVYLERTQRRDGSWQDEHWTGTGFPKVFYLRYHLYASYFSLQALALYRKVLELSCGVNRAA